MFRELDLAKKNSPEVYGKQCQSCMCDLDFVHFRRDSSRSDGRAIQCIECESQPKLSLGEHVACQTERNYNLEAVKKQRWEDQEELKNDAARIGRPMLASDFLAIVKRLVPNLYITEGRIEGDLAIYQTASCPQSRWGDKDFCYLFYVKGTGVLYEFSTYEFDHVRNIPIKEDKRGWRTVLMRLIKARLLTEAKCDAVFGRPEGPSANRWHREMQRYRQHA